MPISRPAIPPPVAALLDHDIPLYSAHIPLDVHPEVGNNAVLAERLGIRVEGRFGEYRGISHGVWGEARQLTDKGSGRARARPGAAYSERKRRY